MAVVFIHGSHTIPFTLTAFDRKIDLQHSQDLFRFCVPVFIFLWAYFQEISFIKRGEMQTMKRFYKLFVPFIFWSLVYFFLTADAKGLSIVKIVVKYWTGYGWSGQYYFIILFQLLLLFPVIASIARKVSAIVSLEVIFIVSIAFYAFLAYSNWFELKIFNQISNRLFVYWLPYIFIVVAYARGKRFKLNPSIFVSLLSLLLILIEASFIKTTDPYLRPSVFICSIFLSVAFINPNVNYNFLPKSISNICHVIAQNTLAIFCLNPLIIITLSKLYNQHLLPVSFPGASILIPIFSVLLVCAIAVVISKLFQKIKLGFLLAN
ncbi:acyltransferase family protein [Mucilaginibacter sp. KACC 22063]|uniref:acyltransferase family protein n=1 Tax=Mucilaginibacter sp. KACC 22063 TaxID=3025666 RepID=UPI0023664660|nr:acyltransferase family protein [Mucilaginibacter sp. KACC 22063]WDF57465.1 acyltransferase family protein [Mucilaginibacter sp. KACC 22063]